MACFYTDSDIFDFSRAPLKKRINPPKKNTAGNINANHDNIPDKKIYPENFPEISKFLRKFGLVEFRKKNPLEICRHSEFPQLIQISPGNFSEKSSVLYIESNGFIVDESQDFLPVCFGNRKILNLSEISPKILDENFLLSDRVEISEKINGIPAYLYYYKNQWHVASQCIKIHFSGCFF